MRIGNRKDGIRTVTIRSAGATGTQDMHTVAAHMVGTLTVTIHTVDMRPIIVRMPTGITHSIAPTVGATQAQ
jgi:hypothetical protein